MASWPWLKYLVRGGTHTSSRRVFATPPDPPLGTRRRFAAPPRSAVGLALCAAAIAGLAFGACRSGSSGKPVRRAKQRVFVLGFDGMDPTLARKWMDEGKLPN